MHSPSHGQQQNDMNNSDEVNPIADDVQASTSSQPIIAEEKEDNESLGEGGNSLETNESEQQIVHN
jgi:hypothetical protein